MTLTDSTPDEIAALREVLAPAVHEFEGNCYEGQKKLRNAQRRRWLAYDVWCFKPELRTAQCLALVDEVLPSLTEKTTAGLALLLTLGNLGGFAWMLSEVLA